MKIERVRTEGASGAIRVSRRDFLKIGGTGLVGAALLGTAGCGVFQQQGGQQGGGGGGESNESITFNLGDTVRDLDSTTTTDSVSFDILLNTIEGLYRLDENQEPVPAQAESVEISDDQLTYTFTLRDGIKWSNGDPVTSQDFKFAWMRALAPDTAGQYAYIVSTFIKGASEFNAGEGSAEDVAIETPDDKTLRVTLVQPSPFWLGLTNFIGYLPQNQKFVEQQGDKYAQSADALLYNGPYTMTELKPTQGMTLQKYKDYWDAGNVDIEKVEGRIVKELDTAVNLYESGELDVQGIEGEYIDEYKDSPEFHTLTNLATFYLVFNFREEIFQNENIRKAFQMGFDRQALTDQILKDGSAPATGFVPDGMSGPGDQTFREAQGPVMPEYDPDQAKQLYQQGVEEVGQDPTIGIELLAYDDSTARDIAAFLQSQFQENLGAKIDVKVQPFDRKLELESNGEFQLSWQGWIADYDDPINFLELFESDNAFNTQKYANERFDQLIEGARTETDEARRMDMLLEAETILVEEDAGTAPMYFEGEARLQKPYLKNYVSHPYGAGRDIKLWKVEK